MALSHTAPVADDHIPVEARDVFLAHDAIFDPNCIIDRVARHMLVAIACTLKHLGELATPARIQHEMETQCRELLISAAVPEALAEAIDGIRSHHPLHYERMTAAAYLPLAIAAKGGGYVPDTTGSMDPRGTWKPLDEWLPICREARDHRMATRKSRSISCESEQ